MGFTHYAYTDGWNAEDEKGWGKALPIIKKILKKYKDIVRFEDDSKRNAVANKAMIRFNGIGEDGHETFLVQNSAKQNDYGTNPGFTFCKTARKPYDIVVCEVCLVLKAFCPHFNLSSDGFSGYTEKQKDGVTLDGTWDEAMENVKEYGLVYRGEITGTRGGKDGEPNPYCDFDVILDSAKEPALVK